MKKRLLYFQKGGLALLCTILFYGLIVAQTGDLQLITTGGGFSESDQLSMSFTIGEISISTQNNASYIMTQGFQQSFPLLSPLPGELRDFSAQRIEQTAELLWHTVSESNHAGFEIERSGDGEDWENIGFVGSQGNSSELRKYLYTDHKPLSGNNYYRLRQIDWNGQYEYSTMRHVFFTENKNTELHVYPNPNSGHFTIGINNPDGESAVVQLLTSSGSLIWQQNFGPGEMTGFWEKAFTLEQRELYFIVSRIGEEINTEKIAVINKD